MCLTMVLKIHELQLLDILESSPLRFLLKIRDTLVSGTSKKHSLGTRNYGVSKKDCALPYRCGD